MGEGAGKQKLWKEQERGTCLFLFSSFQIFSLSFLDSYESQTGFSQRSVPRFNSLKLSCHPPEVDRSHPLRALMPHGILDQRGGACRRCHTNLCPGSAPSLLPWEQRCGVPDSDHDCSQDTPGKVWPGQKCGILEIGQGEFEPYSQRPCLD